MAPSLTQLIVAALILATIGVYWFFLGRGRWRSRLEDRFVYGIPWGSLMVVTIVVAFYLLAQGGLAHWNQPVVFAFVSWSFFYPLGLVTSGIGHGSPAHLVSNMAGTLALAPIAEYAWGHYAGGRSASGEETEDGADDRNDNRTDDGNGAGHRNDDGVDDENGGGADDEATAERGDHANAETDDGTDAGAGDGTAGQDDWTPDDELLPDGASLDGGRRVVDTPWIRAVVLFPGALFAAALLTSVYSLGPSIGFSGAVFAIIGFSLVTYPLTSVVGIVAASALGALWQAVSAPIVTQGIESGAPAPPSWAGIAFQAHALGFLLGVFAGLALLYRRSRRPSTERVLAGVLLVGFVQQLWLLVWPAGSDLYTLYRGPGVVALLVLAGLVAVAAGGKRSRSLVSRRSASIAALVILAALLAFPSMFLGIVAVDDAGVPGSQEVEIRDYNVAYADNATSGHAFGIDLGAEEDLVASEITGVVVTSERRQVWTRAVHAGVLEHSGNATVAVGGVGWQETVRAQRTGWTVAGNDTVYAVDLHHDGETTRSFTSAPSTADARIDGYTAAIAPTNETFEVRIRNGSGVVETVPVPETNSSRSIAGIELSTESDGDARRLYLESGDGRAFLAEAEQYDD